MWAGHTSDLDYYVVCKLFLSCFYWPGLLKYLFDGNEADSSLGLGLDPVSVPTAQCWSKNTSFGDSSFSSLRWIRPKILRERCSRICQTSVQLVKWPLYLSRWPAAAARTSGDVSCVSLAHSPSLRLLRPIKTEVLFVLNAGQNHLKLRWPTRYVTTKASTTKECHRPRERSTTTLNKRLRRNFRTCAHLFCLQSQSLGYSWRLEALRHPVTLLGLCALRMEDF